MVASGIPLLKTWKPVVKIVHPMVLPMVPCFSSWKSQSQALCQPIPQLAPAHRSTRKLGIWELGDKSTASTNTNTSAKKQKNTSSQARLWVLPIYSSGECCNQAFLHPTNPRVNAKVVSDLGHLNDCERSKWWSTDWSPIFRLPASFAAECRQSFDHIMYVGAGSGCSDTSWIWHTNLYPVYTIQDHSA
jgi:hypothetical protein